MFDDPELLTEAKLADFEGFFAPLARMLEAFAERHNLRVDKYHRGQANWDFDFRLPDGSTGHFQVLRVSGDEVLIAGTRELWDVTRFRRSKWTWEPRVVKREDPSIPVLLKSLLTEMVTLPSVNLKSDGKDYSRLWNGQTDVNPTRCRREANTKARIDGAQRSSHPHALWIVYGQRVARPATNWALRRNPAEARASQGRNQLHI